MYLALARKYRPQTFDELIGQPHITRTLQNAIVQGKLYPTLIFSGMKGVGKTSTARILAKALNCVDGPTPHPCNTCERCMEITADRSPDYIEIDGASNNGVDDIRTLRETVTYKPINSRFRVVVIDEVHMLSNSAWNALLKTIEEPPEHTYFIMATTDFHKIPATIVSRCQQLEFKRIPLEIIKGVLRDIADKEGISAGDYALLRIAKAANGGLRDAKKILDQAIALSNGQVRDEEVASLLGVVDESILLRFLSGILNADRRMLIQDIDQICERGTDLRFFYGEWLHFLRDVLVLATVPDAEGLHALSPEGVKTVRTMIPEQASEADILRLIHVSRDLEQTLRMTETPRIMLEYLMIKLSFLPGLVPIEKIIHRIQSLPTMPTSAAAPGRVAVPAPLAQAPASPPPPSGRETPFTPPGQEVLDDLRGQRPRLATQLEQARWSWSGEELVLTAPPEQMDLLRSLLELHGTDFRRLLSDRAQRPVTYRLETSAPIKKAANKSDIQNDPKITLVMERLKARVVGIHEVKEEKHHGQNAQYESNDENGSGYGPPDGNEDE